MFPMRTSFTALISRIARTLTMSDADVNYNSYSKSPDKLPHVGAFFVIAKKRRVHR